MGCLEDPDVRLGCSKCRFSHRGCQRCKQPGFASRAVRNKKPVGHQVTGCGEASPDNRYNGTENAPARVAACQTDCTEPSSSASPREVLTQASAPSAKRQRKTSPFFDPAITAPTAADPAPARHEQTPAVASHLENQSGRTHPFWSGRGHQAPASTVKQPADASTLPCVSTAVLKPSYPEQAHSAIDIDASAPVAAQQEALQENVREASQTPSHGRCPSKDTTTEQSLSIDENEVHQPDQSSLQLAGALLQSAPEKLFSPEQHCLTSELADGLPSVDTESDTDSRRQSFASKLQKTIMQRRQERQEACTSPARQSRLLATKSPKVLQPLLHGHDARP